MFSQNGFRASLLTSASADEPLMQRLDCDVRRYDLRAGRRRLKLCVETAGSIYARYFPKNSPARIFVNVPAWPGHFDIEIEVADRT